MNIFSHNSELYCLCVVQKQSEDAIIDVCDKLGHWYVCSGA